MDWLSKIEAMLQDGYKVRKTYIGTLGSEIDGASKDVTVNGEYLWNYIENGHYDFNWGYGGTGPYWLGQSVAIDLFGMELQDDNVEAYRVIRMYTQDIFKHLNMNQGFRLTDVEIARQIYPRLKERLGV